MNLQVQLRHLLCRLFWHHLSQHLSQQPHSPETPACLLPVPLLITLFQWNQFPEHWKHLRVGLHSLVPGYHSLQAQLARVPELDMQVKMPKAPKEQPHGSFFFA